VGGWRGCRGRGGILLASAGAGFCIPANPDSPGFLPSLGNDAGLLVFWDFATLPACLSFPICSRGINHLSRVKNLILWCRIRASFSYVFKSRGLGCDGPGLCGFAWPLALSLLRGSSEDSGFGRQRSSAHPLPHLGVLG